MTQNNNTALQRFNRIWDKVNADFHKASGRMGLADSELTILYMLCDYQRPFTQSEIIQLTVLGERSSRQRQMTLTDKGENIAREKIFPFMKLESGIFDQWTEDERETFLMLMERYERSLNEITEQIENTRR